MERRLEITRIVVDILCLLFAYIPWLLLIRVAKPYHRGFFCGDESISHPYKDSTISTPVLSVVGVCVPIITFLVTEGVHTHNSKRRRISEPPFYIGDKAFPAFVYRCYRVIGYFLFGLAVTMLITNIGKFSIGRLRPHFFSVCKPNYGTFNCTNPHNIPLYIEDDVCLGEHDTKKFKEMRLSFPSGHASIAMYCMLFACMYLYARFTWKGSKLLCPLLQMILILMAIYCCFSRVSDYKHHWSDVLAGAIIGVIMACLTVCHMTGLYSHRRSPSLPSLTESIGEEGTTHTAPSRQHSKVTYLVDDNQMAAPTPLSIVMQDHRGHPSSPTHPQAGYYGNNNRTSTASIAGHPDIRNHGDHRQPHSYNLQH